MVGIAALIWSNVSETREENDWNAIVFFFSSFFLVGPCEAVSPAVCWQGCALTSINPSSDASSNRVN